MLEASSFWLVLLVLCVSGIVQGSSGFGFSLVAVGLLGILLNDPKTGVILPVFANLILTAFMFWRFRSQVAWSRILPFLGASLCGVPLGVWLLAKANAEWITAGLAAVLIFSGIYALLPAHRRKTWHRLWLGIPCGLASGGLSGAFNTGGPPAVAYMSNQSLPRLSFVASLQFIFMANGILRLSTLCKMGMITRKIVSLGMIGTLAAIIGCLIGNWILLRISDQGLRRYVCGFQILLGVIYAFRFASTL